MKFLTGIFWIRPRNKFPQENIDYTFVDLPLDTGETVSAVRILVGPYKGIVYSYGWVAPRPGDDGVHVLEFNFTLHDIGERDKMVLAHTPAFTTQMGDILSSIIINHKEGSLELMNVKEEE